VQELIDAANTARDNHREAEKHAKELRSKLDELESKLNMDYGENREWAESHGKCYESKNGEYVTSTPHLTHTHTHTRTHTHTHPHTHTLTLTHTHTHTHSLSLARMCHA
jgi:hypothetical protein